MGQAVKMVGGKSSHLNLTKSLVLPPLYPNHREAKGRNIEPYRDTPKPPTGKVPFAGADPLENEDW